MERINGESCGGKAGRHGKRKKRKKGRRCGREVMLGGEHKQVGA